MVAIAERLAALEEGIGELVARNDTATSLESLRERYTDDPHGFLREVLRMELWAGQERISDAIRSHSRVAVYGANSVGKGHVTAGLILWWIYCQDGHAVLTATTERTAKGAIMRYIRQLYHRGNLPGELYEMGLRIEGDPRLWAFASNAMDKVTGLHAPRLLVVVDEGQGVEPQIYEALHALIPAKTVVLGNPLRNTGPFFEICKSGRWYAVQLSALEHPNIRESREVIPGGPTREWCDHMAAEYGEDSPVYVARVLGRFPETSIDAVFERAWLEAAVQRYKTAELEREAREHRCTLALDVARFGEDATALCTMQGPVVRELTTWRHEDLVETANRFQAAAKAWSFDGERKPRLIADAHGIGAAVVDVLKHRGITVQEFLGWNPAADSRKYRNKRAESYFALREALRAGKIAMPHDGELFHELMAVTWFLDNAGRVQLEKKEDIRAAIGQSTDRADALTMATYHAVYQRQKAQPFAFEI